MAEIGIEIEIEKGTEKDINTDTAKEINIDLHLTYSSHCFYYLRSL